MDSKTLVSNYKLKDRFAKFVNVVHCQCYTLYDTKHFLSVLMIDLFSLLLPL